MIFLLLLFCISWSQCALRPSTQEWLAEVMPELTLKCCPPARTAIKMFKDPEGKKLLEESMETHKVFSVSALEDLISADDQKTAAQIFALHLKRYREPFDRRLGSSKLFVDWLLRPPIRLLLIQCINTQNVPCATQMLNWIYYEDQHESIKEYHYEKNSLGDFLRQSMNPPATDKSIALFKLFMSYGARFRYHGDDCYDILDEPWKGIYYPRRSVDKTEPTN